MKITRENLKNIVREAMVEESAYQAFFKKALEKTGKSIPDMSDEEKKAFFNKIDSAWKGKGEKKNEGNAFGAAVVDAKKDGDDSFKVSGKEYKVESNEEDLDEEAVVVSKRTPEGNIVSKLKEESVVTEAKDNLYLQLHKKYAKQIKGLKAKKIKKLTDLVSVQRYSMEDREDYFDMDSKKKKELSKEYDTERKLFKKYIGGDESVMLPKGTETLSENNETKNNETMHESVNEASINEIDTKKANLIRKSMPGYVGPKFAKKASDEDLLAMADLKDEKAQLYNRYLKDVMSKISNLQKKYNIKESVNESQVVNKKTGKDITRHVLDLLSGKIDKKQFEKLTGLKKESTNERLGSDKVEVGNANFNNHLKEIGDDKNSFVAFIDTNKGKKLLKVFKTQQTAKRFVNKNMDKMLDTKGVESIGTMSKKEWDTKEAKYAIK